MMDYLMKPIQCISYLEAEKHVHQIYKSTRINRLTPPEWNQLFASSRFSFMHISRVNPQNISDLGLPAYQAKRVAMQLFSSEVCSGYKLIASTNI